MTFRHLANMVSGYARVEPPGTAWAYNDYAFKLYALTMQDVFQQTLDEAALQRFAPLQFEDGSLFTSREGLGISTTPRDFARIGLFWLNRGNWNGSQLLPQSYFDNYMKPGVPNDLPGSSAETSDYLGIGTHGGDTDQMPYGPGIYGFNWWFNAEVGTSGQLTWPDAPPDTFQANGHWGEEVVTIIPSLRMIVAARGYWGSFVPGDASTGMNQVLKLLVESVDNCEGNFNCSEDLDVDGTDAFIFKADFARHQLRRPCTNEDPCNGDFTCDADVDGSDVFLFKSDFGRNSSVNPCLPCASGIVWCNY
jgi:CubicO group peptidase (beta-lactamase class C family)